MKRIFYCVYDNKGELLAFFDTLNVNIAWNIFYALADKGATTLATVSTGPSHKLYDHWPDRPLFFLEN